MPTPADAPSIQGSPAPLAGKWAVNFNGYTGTLALAPDGTATLNLGSGQETLTAVRYNSTTHEVTFTRPISGGAHRQVYAGRLTREGFAEGTFDCTISGRGFRWFSQQTERAPATTQTPTTPARETQAAAPAEALTPARAESLVSGATVSIARSRFAPSERIAIAFTAPSGLPSNAWMGIVPAAIDHGDEARNNAHDITYQHLAARTAGTLTFGPIAPGEWTARTNSGGRELAWAAFTIAPEVVPPGQKQPSLRIDRTRFAPSERIPVTFTAPTAYPSNAWVGIVPAHIDHGDEARNNAHDITFQHVASRAEGTLTFGPFAPGEWTARMNVFGIETASAAFEVAPEVVPPGQNPPSLAVQRTHFCPWERIPVSFTAPTAYPSNAWVGIVPAGIDHGDEARNNAHDITFQHVASRAEGTLTFGPFAPGEWTARMNVFGIETASVAFTIAPEVVPPGQNPPTLTLARTVFAPGEAITVSFTAPTAYPSTSWVGLIPAHIDHGSVPRNDQHDVTFQHLASRGSGTLTFRAPAPGHWTFRMNTGDSRAETASVEFEVK